MKLLLVSGSKNHAERERMGKFSEILSSYGVEAIHAIVESAERLVEAASGIDMVFCVPSHIPDLSGKLRNIHGILEGEGIPYVGSGPDALELALSKGALKEKWGECGVRTPGFFLARRLKDDGDDYMAKVERAWDFPYIVKPAREGNSRGIGIGSVAHTRMELSTLIASLLENYDEVLAEHFLGSRHFTREFTVAMIGNGPGRILLPASISFKGCKNVRIVTTEDKVTGRALAKPVKQSGFRERIVRFAMRALGAAGVRDYARCDVMECGGMLYAIEVNGQPMVPDPWFEACAKGGGFEGAEYLAAIVFSAAIRYDRGGGERPLVDGRFRSSMPGFVLEALEGRVRDEAPS